MADPISSEQLDEIGRRLTELSGRMDWLVSFGSQIGTWVAAVGTLVGLLIAVASLLGISGAFFSRRALKKSQSDFEDLNARATKLAQDIERLSNDLKLGQQCALESVDKKVAVYRHLLAGELCYRNSDFNGGVEHFKRCLNLDQDHWEANYYLARCLTYQNNILHAEEILQKLLTQKPDEPLILRSLALAKRFLDKDEALKLLNLADQKATQPPLEKVGLQPWLKTEIEKVWLKSKIENDKGLIYRDMGKYEESRNRHNAALSYKPLDCISLYFLGIAEIRCGREEEGKSHINQAATSAYYLVRTQEIKEIWEKIIVWSSLVVNNEPETAKDTWRKLSTGIKSPYTKETIEAHVSCICVGLRLHRSDFVDEDKKHPSSEAKRISN